MPIQQSEVFVARAKAVGAKAALVRKPGKAHGWPGLDDDHRLVADWFDEHLLGKARH